MSSGSFATDSGSDQQQTSLGISYNHAYTLLGAVKLSDGTKLFKLRNPWGTEKYQGPWSDSSAKWNDQFKAEVKMETLNDGTFFMDVPTYKTQFEDTTINWAIEDFEHQYFAKFNDDSGKPGRYSWCGSWCKMHSFSLKSDVHQSVYIVAHTWPDRSYPASCTQKSNSWGGFNLNVSGEPYVQYFNSGSKTIVKEVAAGTTVSIDMTFDWNDANISKDWALHIYSDHPVTFTNTDGNTSDTAEQNPFLKHHWIQ